MPDRSITCLEEVTAMILAGGLGTRLRPVVADRSKVLAMVNGRPFLEYLLDELVTAGLRSVILCTGYRAEQIVEHFGSSYHGMAIRYSQEQTPLGTAGAFRLALSLTKSDPVLAMNGDSFCAVDFRAFWRSHLATGAAGTLVVRQSPDTRQQGRVECDAERKITRFVEKGAMTGPGWINAGIYLLSQSLLQTIPIHRAVSIEKEMFPAWVGKGLHTFPTTGKFLDIGTPETYTAGQQVLGA